MQQPLADPRQRCPGDASKSSTATFSVGGGRVTQRKARLVLHVQRPGSRRRPVRQPRHGTKLRFRTTSGGKRARKRAPRARITQRWVRGASRDANRTWVSVRSRDHASKDGPKGKARTRQVHGKEATKGVWWMPWHLEATKDVANCDMRRVAVREHSIRRFPNGATR